MHITRLTIKNFRGIELVTLEAGRGLNVIAGPNAIGKTTILEAIRLSKALLAQRFGGESQNVLQTMGATQNGVISLNAPFVMLANDQSKPIEISMKLKLNEDELLHIKDSTEQLAVMNLQTDLARSQTDNVTDLAQYLSTVDGQNKLTEIRTIVKSLVDGITLANEFSLSAHIDVNTGQVRGDDPNAQSFITFLERTIKPNQTHFNYFTADRALPAGEVAIQLGAGDVQQQILSYLAMPAMKWQRVKHLIVQTMLFNADGRQILEDEFNLIFDELLPGKKLAGVSLNENGVLKVIVEEKATGKQFDIDSMSSGEKGLVLTFLTLRLSSKDSTIVMLDEPELHLNAAVCSRIVNYMKKHCVSAKSLQLFVCSHSPEIVRDAFEDESCKLFHLRSSTDLSPVYQEDSKEVFEILNRLGASTADVLFSRGSVFVEGDHDAAILQTGYPEVLQGFRIQPLGGRTEIEKDIPLLQQKENEQKLDKRQIFIFDRDRNISKLQDTPLVKVYQLERYCIENYLLDEKILYDEISNYASNPPASRGEFAKRIQDLALAQLDRHVISEAYKGMEPTNAGIRAKDVQGKSLEDAASVLWYRIRSIKDEVRDLEENSWIENFISTAMEMKVRLSEEWRTNWKILSSGKILVDDLYREYTITKKKIDFKKSIISRMAEAKSEQWRVLKSVLEEKLNR